MIEERNPLKQGLKRIRIRSTGYFYHNIEERNPLKQGLKQKYTLTPDPAHNY